MDGITEYLRDHCLYDQLKNRIKTNLKKVDKGPQSKVKPANQVFKSFSGTEDGVLSLYLIWDALETLQLTHTMYLFRNETGFDPTTIVDPHTLNHMHELIRDRRHCDVIMAHTMQWYTKDYTPQTDECCQRKLLEGLKKDTGLERFQGTPAKEKVIEKRNLLDGNISRVTVSIHMDDDDREPRVIEIPRDTTASNIQIYLNKSRKDSLVSSCPSKDSGSSSDSSMNSVKTVGKKINKDTCKSKSLDDENDEHGNRREFRRSPSPSRSTFALKGGTRKFSDSSTTCTETGNETDSYSYIHNPDLHRMFLEELRKVKEKKNRENKTAPMSRPPIENKCQTSPNVNNCSPSSNPGKIGDTVLIGYLVKREVCPHMTLNQAHHSSQVVNNCPTPQHLNHSPTPSNGPHIPHLVNQCQQVGSLMGGNPLRCQPPRPSPSSPDRNCFSERVRRGTDDLIASSEQIRRFQDVSNSELDRMQCEMDEQDECKTGFVEDIAWRVDQIKLNENVNKPSRLCGSMASQKHKCPSPRSCSPINPPQFRTDGQCNPASHNLRNEHPGMTCQNHYSGEPGCHGYQPEIMSEFE